MRYDAPQLTADQEGIFVIGEGRVMSGISTTIRKRPGMPVL